MAGRLFGDKLVAGVIPRISSGCLCEVTVIWIAMKWWKNILYLKTNLSLDDPLPSKDIMMTKKNYYLEAVFAISILRGWSLHGLAYARWVLFAFYCPWVGKILLFKLFQVLDIALLRFLIPIWSWWLESTSWYGEVCRLFMKQASSSMFLIVLYESFIITRLNTLLTWLTLNHTEDIVVNLWELHITQSIKEMAGRHSEDELVAEVIVEIYSQNVFVFLVLIG